MNVKSANIKDLTYNKHQYLIEVLTDEVKYGAAALDVSNRQNTHSITLVIRAVVKLFRLIKREKKLNREVLTFSISYNHEFIRIYDHYSIIKKIKTFFY
jgi:hypothetical protein